MQWTQTGAWILALVTGAVALSNSSSVEILSSPSLVRVLRPEPHSVVQFINNTFHRLTSKLSPTAAPTEHQTPVGNLSSVAATSENSTSPVSPPAVDQPKSSQIPLSDLPAVAPIGGAPQVTPVNKTTLHSPSNTSAPENSLYVMNATQHTGDSAGHGTLLQTLPSKDQDAGGHVFQLPHIGFPSFPSFGGNHQVENVQVDDDDADDDDEEEATVDEKTTAATPKVNCSRQDYEDSATAVFHGPAGPLETAILLFNSSTVGETVQPYMTRINATDFTGLALLKQADNIDCSPYWEPIHTRRLSSGALASLAG